MRSAKTSLRSKDPGEVIARVYESRLPRRQKSVLAFVVAGGGPLWVVASRIWGRHNVHLHLGSMLTVQFEARRAGHQRISAGARVVLSSQHLVGADFGGRRLAQFSSDGCRFEGCGFEGAVIESASFGAGRQVSEYIGCNFEGARLRMGPGGYARFVDCSFESTTIEHWICYAVEVVGCRFSGRLKKVVFNGTVPIEDRIDVRRVTNQFDDNDFSRATLIDVGFRTGIDLSQQRLPEGEGYTYFEDSVAAVRSARLAFDAWDDADARSAAQGVLAVMEQDVAEGQRQLLIRVDDYPRRDRAAIRVLLNAAKDG